ncbi:MAG: ribonuclease Z [Candidatus Nanohaloarchaeota archaeon QJJ-9]|nr:ribonuclease Z [Candidatus Nanohaloarchaeota archaeon QJJ-9]
MTRFYTLGTSSAVPTAKRDLAANLLDFQGEKILFDCGEGTQKTLMKYQLGLMQIDKVFITHWHADHFSGLLGLVQTLGMEGRDRPLYIYGPEGTEENTKRLLELGHFNRQYDIYADDLEPGDRVEGDEYEIRAFRTDHRVPSLGFVFEEEEKTKASRKKMEELGLEPSPKIGRLKEGESVEIDGETIKPEQVVEKVPGRKVVYTGDTEYSEKTVKASKNADLLVHDSTFTQDLVKDGREKHASAKQAAEVAKKAGVEKLVLTHFSRRFDKDASPLLEEAEEVFENSVLAEEGKEFEVKPHRPE